MKISESSKSSPKDDKDEMELYRNNLKEAQALSDRLEIEKNLMHKNANKNVIKRIFGSYVRFTYKRVPLALINYQDFERDALLLKNAYKGLRSPICPQCNNGILMYDQTSVVRNQVEWFCSNSNLCNFSTISEPSFSKIEQKIQEILPSLKNASYQKWKSLTEDEKQNLISRHLLQSKIYLFLTAIVLSIICAEILYSFYFVALLMIPLTCLTYLIALKWGYRAWQVKTGKVFLPKSPFILWLKTAKKYHNVDWVDQA